MEPTVIRKEKGREMPGWLLAIIEQIWEVIKIELDTYFGRIRRRD